MNIKNKFKYFGLICVITFCFLILSSTEVCADARMPHWEFAGWYGGGCFPALVSDPLVEGRLYLLSDVAGLWRSDDRGENWYFINNGLTNLNIATLAIAPSDSNVIYIGTKVGMMCSSDGGSNWQVLVSTKDKITFERPNSYRAICIDSKNSSIVYVGTKNGRIFYTKNAGISWNQLSNVEYPFGKETSITAIIKEAGYIFVSSKEGLIRYSLSKKRWDIVIQGKEILDMEYSQDILYIGVDNRVSYSKDSGLIWQDTEQIPQGRVTRLSVSKSKEGGLRFLVGWQKNSKGGMYLSIDIGKSWESLGKNLVYNEKLNPTRLWMKGFGKPTSVSLDPFNAKIMYFTDWWGVWRSDDNGSSWLEKINGAPNSSGSDIAITSKGDILVATMDNGLLRSSDEGKTYEAIFPGAGSYGKSRSGHVWRVLTYGENAENILATSSPWNESVNQVILSNDGGGTFQLIREGVLSQRPKVNTMWGQGYPRALAIDPTDSNNVYLGIDGDDGGGLFRSNDAGKSWHRSEGQPGSLRIYNALAVDPANPKRIFWGASGRGGGVYISGDGGNSWRKVLTRLGTVFDLVKTPSGIILAAGGDGEAAIYRSEDNGQTWQKVFGSIEADACEALSVNLISDKVIVAGVVNWSEKSGGRVILSKDTGRHWEDITGDLPISQGPSASSFNTKDGYLYTLLYAGSVYKTKIGKN